MAEASASRKRDRAWETLARMARTDLRRVIRARRRLEAALEERDAAIRAAVASGETHRDVARMAGLSHQRVAQIVAKE